MSLISMSGDDTGPQSTPTPRPPNDGVVGLLRTTAVFLFAGWLMAEQQATPATALLITAGAVTIAGLFSAPGTALRLLRWIGQRA